MKYTITVFFFIMFCIADLWAEDAITPAQQKAWHTILLQEAARLKTEIETRTNLSAEYFIVAEDSATDSELETNLINLLVVSYDLKLAEPITGIKTSKRASTGMFQQDAAEEINEIKASRKHMESQSTKIHDELSRLWNATLAMEEIRLNASLRYWDDEIRRLQELLRGNP